VSEMFEWFTLSTYSGCPRALLIRHIQLNVSFQTYIHITRPFYCRYPNEQSDML
jgi:hypothetical protein